MLNTSKGVGGGGRSAASRRVASTFARSSASAVARIFATFSRPGVWLSSGVEPMPFGNYATRRAPSSAGRYS